MILNIKLCNIKLVEYCASKRKVAGSIPVCVIGTLPWHIPSGRNMAVGLTQPLTEMSTKNISLELIGRYVGLKTYRLHVPIVLKSGSLNLVEPVQASNGIALPFYLYIPYKVATVASS
jgi:hypothetical protein